MAITSHTTIFDGDTALLLCVGYGLPDIDFTWAFNGQNITNSSLINIYGDREGVLRKSFIEICGASRSSSGIYTCTISNG